MAPGCALLGGDAGLAATGEFCAPEGVTEEIDEFLRELSGVGDELFYRKLLSLRPREDALPVKTNYVFMPYAD